VRSSLPSVLEERLPFFPEPKAFGSADGWPAEGRPAGGGARGRGSTVGETAANRRFRRFDGVEHCCAKMSATSVTEQGQAAR